MKTPVDKPAGASGGLEKTAASAAGTTSAAAIASELAGDPAAEADAPVDPRAGFGSLHEGLRPAFVPLTDAEITAINADLALMPAEMVAAFRARLAGAPIDPVKGQGSLDEGTPWAAGVAKSASRLHGALASLAAGRPVPPVPELDARSELDPDRDYVRVVATRDGHRRAGRAWSRSAVFVPVDELDDVQLEQLRADPSLIVSRA